MFDQTHNFNSTRRLRGRFVILPCSWIKSHMIYNHSARFKAWWLYFLRINHWHIFMCVRLNECVVSQSLYTKNPPVWKCFVSAIILLVGCIFSSLLNRSNHSLFATLHTDCSLKILFCSFFCVIDDKALFCVDFQLSRCSFFLTLSPRSKSLLKQFHHWMCSALPVAIESIIC